ncbi:MAG: hypothetical protein AAGJ94_14640 [Pseudomonadota bacterium]
MFERFTPIRWLKKVCVMCVCHRAIYGALSACHGSGCVITDKPELYAPMALLYAVLAVRG